MLNSALHLSNSLHNYLSSMKCTNSIRHTNVVFYFLSLNSTCLPEKSHHKESYQLLVYLPRCFFLCALSLIANQRVQIINSWTKALNEQQGLLKPEAQGSIFSSLVTKYGGVETVDSVQAGQAPVWFSTEAGEVRRRLYIPDTKGALTRTQPRADLLLNWPPPSTHRGMPPRLSTSWRGGQKSYSDCASPEEVLPQISSPRLVGTLQLCFVTFLFSFFFLLILTGVREWRHFEDPEVFAVGATLLGVAANRQRPTVFLCLSLSVVFVVCVWECLPVGIGESRLPSLCQDVCSSAAAGPAGAVGSARWVGSGWLSQPQSSLHSLSLLIGAKKHRGPVLCAWSAFERRRVCESFVGLALVTGTLTAVVILIVK